MTIRRFEEHLIIYYIAIIVTSFVVHYVLNYFDIFSDVRIKIPLYLFMMVTLSNLLILLTYVSLCEFGLPSNYHTENPIDMDDMILASSSIITIFLIYDLMKLVTNPFLIIGSAVIIFPIVNLINNTFKHIFNFYWGAMSAWISVDNVDEIKKANSWTQNSSPALGILANGYVQCYLKPFSKKKYNFYRGYS